MFTLVRHAERVPYETMWIQSGELNSLGYDVHGHIGGVHLSGGPEPDALGNHLVLTVTGLPGT